MAEPVTNTPCDDVENADGYIPYDKQRLSYANTFPHPAKRNVIRAMEWVLKLKISIDQLPVLPVLQPQPMSPAKRWTMPTAWLVVLSPQLTPPRPIRASLIVSVVPKIVQP